MITEVMTNKMIYYLRIRFFTNQDERRGVALLFRKTLITEKWRAFYEAH